MNTEGTRRVLETTSFEEANEYLRFGWSLINQYLSEAKDNEPACVRYVLAAVRRLEDTRQVAVVSDPDLVNQYLDYGWKLIDKYATGDASEQRNETLHYALAWQTDDPPLIPGAAPPIKKVLDTTPPDEDEL